MFKVNDQKKKACKHYFSKKTELAILLSDNEDFRAKKITKDENQHYIVVKGSVYQDDITVLNVNALNNKVSKYMKQKLIEMIGEIEKSTIIAEDFNSPLSANDRTAGQKIIHDIENPNKDLVGIYSAFYQTGVG